MTVIDVSALRRTFGGLVAVHGIDFTINAGEVIGFIGPNGSGKSTLFNLLTGVLKPDSGKIRLFGEDIVGRPTHLIARAGVARTFQIPMLFWNMTLFENLLAATVEENWATAPSRAEQVLELLELQHMAHHQARDLSGGQQRLLEMGRILMRDPKVVFLDEVAAGVHPRLREIILAAIRRLRERGVSICVIEHDMELTQSICDRMIVMDAGKVIAEGNFDAVTSDPTVMKAYLGDVTL
ncbi:ABC transporter ATP-binding protein [Bordetella tumulicola]|uniref:ABC transporter ATP-binding protein n=1 Tax=Bordetella tumulicola TaxID=1649133 RepID=UPI0039EEE4E6